MIIFVTVAISQLLWTKFKPKVIQVLSLTEQNDSNNKNVKMQRVESEFSLGFERSASFAKALNELGPLCSRGQIAATALKVSSLFLFFGIISSLLISYRLPKARVELLKACQLRS
jgi:hypothetical protein